jgi:hypothetical protein
MNHHEIKILRQHYNNVKAGTKTFEIRNNDRAFQKGDLVTLKAFDPASDRNPGYLSCYYHEMDDLNFTVGDVYPIDAERVVFSLLPIKEQV